MSTDSDLEEIPAEEASTGRRSFLDTLRNIRPQHWRIAVSSFDRNSLDGLPAEVPCPDGGEPLDEHLRKFGFPPGRLKLTLVRESDPKRNKDDDRRAKLHAFRVLTKRGYPRHTVVTLEGASNGNPAPVRAPVPAAQGSRVPRAPSITRASSSDSVALAAEELERERLQVEKLRVERQRRQAEAELQASAPPLDLQRKLDAMQAALERLTHPQPQPRSLLAELAQLAPIVAPLVERWMTSARERDERLLQAIAERAQPVRDDDGDTSRLTSTLALLRELREFAQESSPSSPAEGGTMGAVASIVQALAPQLAAAQQPPQQRPRQRPQGDPMQLRVLSFLSSLSEAAQNELDPIATANELRHAFGLLPGRFRVMVTGANAQPAAIVTGLAAWLSPAQHEQVARAMRDTRVASWFAEFLRALADPDYDGEQSEQSASSDHDEQEQDDEEEAAEADLDAQHEEDDDGVSLVNRTAIEAALFGGSRSQPSSNGAPKT